MKAFASWLLLVTSLLVTPRAAEGQTDTGRVAAPGAARVSDPEPLRPGDTVRLRIWREPDLSGDFQVDETGTVVFPRIGRMRVTEESAVSLESKLVKAFERYLRSPSIEVTLLRRIQVLGAVRDPGLYPVDATMTIADAVALAGGATSEGELNRVYLVREGKRISSTVSGTAPLASLRLRSGDQLFVPERSWISRNPGIVATGISALVSLIVAFSR